MPRQSSTRRNLLAASLIAPSALLAMGVNPAAAQAMHFDPKLTYQLRIYQIFESNKAAFHARFRDHAIRIMKKYDFKIMAIWESQSPERTEFVYLLQWPSEEALNGSWERFLRDQEWSDIKKQSAAQHGQLVGEIQSRVLRLADYSPV